jgi:hypothetical protein
MNQFAKVVSVISRPFSLCEGVCVMRLSAFSLSPSLSRVACACRRVSCGRSAVTEARALDGALKEPLSNRNDLRVAAQEHGAAQRERRQWARAQKPLVVLNCGEKREWAVESALSKDSYHYCKEQSQTLVMLGKTTLHQMWLAILLDSLFKRDESN